MDKLHRDLDSLLEVFGLTSFKYFEELLAHLQGYFYYLTMKGHILIFNSGSSSLKYHVYNREDDILTLVVSGNVEKIGEESSIITTKHNDKEDKKNTSVKDHLEAIKQILKILEDIGNFDFAFIGHRVVHGGLTFQEDRAYRVDDDLIKKVSDLAELSPLHNPVNLEGIKDTIKVFKNTPQVVVFDTSFHNTLPEAAFKYAVPYDELGAEVRKFGFHGVSYKYISAQVTKYLEKTNKVRDLQSLKLIVMHLGNGSSMAAIKGGKCIDTTMGLTPLEGLIMGTRTGDMDPSAVLHILRKYMSPINEESVNKVEQLINKKSGLKGLCGHNDMRKIVEEMKHDENAKLAFDMFCYRIRKYIGTYFVVLGGCDAIVFTGGIGENSADVRATVVQGLSCIGVEIDEKKNAAKSKDPVLDISSENSKISVLRALTDEERQIALMGMDLLD
jgi:acetate kinase